MSIFRFFDFYFDSEPNSNFAPLPRDFDFQDLKSVANGPSNWTLTKKDTMPHPKAIMQKSKIALKGKKFATVIQTR